MDERLLADLCTKVGVTPARVTPIREWAMSGVYRVEVDHGRTVVYKQASAPFLDEAHTVRAAAAAGVPVPRVYVSTRHAHLLGFLMADLGQPVRDPCDDAAACAAVRVHQARPPSGMAVHGAAQLAALPGQALHHLNQLRAAGRFGEATGLDTVLAGLTRRADRAAGADLQPVGLCHGELHPTSLHINPTGWRLLDWAKAFHGPGLLDLATWLGTRNPPDPDRMRNLLHTYVQAGGHPDALTDRGGLPAEIWALAWHRIWSATWLLTQAATAHPIGTDTWCAQVVRRQVTTAAELLQ